MTSGAGASRIVVIGSFDTKGEEYAFLCDAIKSPSTGIVVYTVGFDIADPSQVEERALMTYCACEPDNAFLADNAAELTAAFVEIAGDIQQLRLSE